MRSLVLAFAIASIVILIFLFYPFISLTLSTDKEALQFTLASEEATRALFLSLEASTVSTVILLGLGLPLSYILARFDFRGKGFVESLVDLPLVVPHAVVGIMILTAFGPSTPFGNILRSLGVVMEDSFWAVVAAFCFVSAPLLVDSVKDGFLSIDPYLEGVARSLGAGPWRTFITITLPLGIRGIFTGALLSWARAMSEVGSLLIIAYYPKTINVLIIEWFNNFGLRYSIALTLILLSISIAVFMLLRLVLRWRA